MLWVTGCLENSFRNVIRATADDGIKVSCARNVVSCLHKSLESTQFVQGSFMVPLAIDDSSHSAGKNASQVLSTKMLSPIAGSFLSWYYTFPNVYLVSVRCSCFLQTPQCPLHQVKVRIGPLEKFPHVCIVSAPAHSILFLQDSLCMVLIFICVRHQRRLTILLPGNEKLGCQSEVVLLQVRALLISTSESLYIVVLGGQMDIIAFVSRLSRSQFALGSLALSHNLGACNISCLSYCLFDGLRSKMTG
ncbi:hypothetical protein Pelo_4233 [Pelomyxa schiedti]|nr:hypothetical protein Pelo_4233 [Pelomyxa schiedti]